MRSDVPSNPLALAVLVLLFERPMHPYEIAATLKMRRQEKSIKLRYGSLYTVIDGLLKDGSIAVKETVREGRRPERTIYQITAAGLERMRSWLRDAGGTGQGIPSVRGCAVLHAGRAAGGSGRPAREPITAARYLGRGNSL